MSIIISGSGVRTGASTTKVLEFGTEGTLTLNGDLATTGSAGFTVINATGIAALSGGINVNNDFTVDTAGGVVAVGINAGGALSGVTTLAASGLANLNGGIELDNGGNKFVVSTAGAVTAAAKVTANEFGTDGDEFTVSTAGAVVAVGVNAGGALSGVTTLAASGLASVASISMDDGSTLGPDSVAGLWTFSADGDTTQANGAYDFDLASHDGVNGLKLGGTLVNASAADLNFTNVAAAGTAEASKALVVDSNKDITGGRNVTITGDMTSATLTMSGFSVDADGDVQVKTLDVNSGGITEAGAIAGATTINASGRITGGSFTDGTATLSGGRFAALADLTASYAQIGVLDVTTINSKTTTVENVEVSSSLMILSNGAATANEADGSGLFISGAAASFTWDNGNSRLATNKAVYVAGDLDASGDLTAATLTMTGFSVDADGDVQVKTLDVNSGGITEAGAIAGASTINASGIVTAGGLTVGTAALDEADLEKLDGITNGTALASKALILGSSKEIATIGTIGCGAITSTGASSMGSLDVAGALTCDTSFTLDSVAINATELGFIDGVTAGTAAASKAMVLDASADITGGRNLTISGELDAATLDISGIVQVDGATTFGVNDTGVDVKMFGGTAGSYMLWDEDQNTLKLNAAPLSGTTVCVMGAAPSSGVAIATPETWAVKAGQFITYSDGTLKKNVKQLDGAIEKVMSMRGVSYEMKKGAEGRTEVGFIAQEMKQLVPEVVYGDADGNYGIDYGKITSVLVEAVKAQQSQIEELKALLKK